MFLKDELATAPESRATCRSVALAEDRRGPRSIAAMAILVSDISADAAIQARIGARPTRDTHV